MPRKLYHDFPCCYPTQARQKQLKADRQSEVLIHSDGEVIMGKILPFPSENVNESGFVPLHQSDGWETEGDPHGMT